MSAVSQSELAERIRLSKLSLLINRKNASTPKIETIKKIADFYGITVGQLMMLVELINTNDSEKSKLTDKLFCQLISRKNE